jgi:uncharacterized protein DUF2569
MTTTMIPKVADRFGESGVGGWLFLLIIGLAVLGPFRTWTNYEAEIVDFERKTAGLAANPIWHSLKMVTLEALGLGCAIGFIAAALLVGRFRRSTPPIVMVLLFMMAMLPPLFEYLSYYFIYPAALNPDVAAQQLVAAAPGLLYAMVWSTYLYRSKRVKATYVG